MWWVVRCHIIFDFINFSETFYISSHKIDTNSGAIRIYLCHESHRHIEVRGSMRREGAQERVCEDEERRENEREHRDTKRDRIYPAFKDIWDIRCHAMLMDNGESDAFC